MRLNCEKEKPAAVSFATSSSFVFAIILPYFIGEIGMSQLQPLRHSDRKIVFRSAFSRLAPEGGDVAQLQAEGPRGEFGQRNAAQPRGKKKMAQQVSHR